MKNHPTIKILNNKEYFELSPSVNILTLENSGKQLVLIHPESKRPFKISEVTLQKDHDHLWIQCKEYPEYPLTIKNFFIYDNDKLNTLTFLDDNDEELTFSKFTDGFTIETISYPQLEETPITNNPQLLMGTKNNAKTAQDEKPEDSKSLFSDSILWIGLGGVLSAIGGWKIVENLSKDEKKNSTPTSTSESLDSDTQEQPTIQGKVTLGPVFPEHGLSLLVTTVEGRVLTTSEIDQYGNYSVNLTQLPDQVKLIIKDNSDEADYIDESTGELKDLTADLIAWTSLDPAQSTHTIEVNPLTTLAANLAEKAALESDTPLTNEQLANVNSSVAKLFIGEEADITSYEIEPVIDVLGNTSTGNTGGDALALISAMESKDSITTEEVIELLEAGITFNDGSLSINAETVAYLKESQEQLPEALSNSGDLVINLLTDSNEKTNLAPTSSSKQFSIIEDSQFQFTPTVFAFFDENENDALNLVNITRLPEAGSLYLGDEKITELRSLKVTELSQLAFKPETNASGLNYASLSFNVSDGALTSNEESISFHVLNENDLPVSASVTKTITEDEPYQFSIDDFAFNDADNDALSAIIIAELPQSGNLTLNDTLVVQDQSITASEIAALIYTPEAEASGDDVARMGVFVSDGIAQSSDMTEIQFDIAAINDAPIAIDRTVTINEDFQYAFSVLDFGFEDTEGDDFHSLQISSMPSKGNLTFNGLSAIEGLSIPIDNIVNLHYSAEPNEHGFNYTYFDFKVSDGNTLSDNTAIIQIHISPLNDPPVASNGAISIDEDESYQFSVDDFSFSDSEGDALQSIVIDSLPENGELTLNNEPVTEAQEVTAAEIPNLNYTPDPDSSGDGYANFDYRVNDGSGISEEAAEMNVNVASVEDTPESTGGAVQENEDSSVQLSEADFPFNDGDGDTLHSIIIDSLPANGELLLSGEAVTVNQVILAEQLSLLSYVPLADASGDNYASIGYRVSDGKQYSDVTAYLQINITEVNDPPTATGKIIVINEDEAYQLAIEDFGFSDLDTPQLTSVIIDNPPELGTLSLNGIPTLRFDEIAAADIANLTYTPVENAEGANYAQIEYRVFDGEFYNAQTVALQFDITGINDAPIAMNKRIGGTYEETPMLILTEQILELIDDPEGDALTIDSVTIDSNHGTISEPMDDWLLFTPAQDLTHENLPFDVLVSDHELQTNFEFYIRVINVNDAPVSIGATVGMEKNTTYTFSVDDFAFTDIENDALVSVTIDTLPAAGSLSLSGDPVTASQQISAADIANLTFTPVTDAVSTSYASIGYRVNDGTDSSLSTANIQLDVNEPEPLPGPAYQLSLANEDISLNLLEPHILNGQYYYLLDVNGDNQITDEDRLNQQAVNDLMASGTSIYFDNADIILANESDITDLNLGFTNGENNFWGVDSTTDTAILYTHAGALSDPGYSDHGYLVYQLIS